MARRCDYACVSPQHTSEASAAGNARFSSSSSSSHALCERDREREKKQIKTRGNKSGKGEIADDYVVDDEDSDTTK